MAKIRHERPDCRTLIPPATFESLKRAWPGLTLDDGSPLVTVHCPGCHSDVCPENFVTVPTTLLPPTS